MARSAGQRLYPGAEARAKARAAGLHLALSAVAFAALLGLTLPRWYPAPFFRLDGGWPGLRLLLLVSLVSGPLLTGVVYGRRKSRPKLLFDLVVIGTLQAGLLGFGLWTLFDQRTVLVVFADGSFYTLNREWSELAGPRASEILRQSRSLPAYAVVRMPGDPAGAQRLRIEALRSKRPLFLRGDLLEPLDASTLPSVVAAGMSPSDWAGSDPTRGKAVARFEPSETVFVRLVLRYGSTLLALDRNSGKVLGEVEGAAGR